MYMIHALTNAYQFIWYTICVHLVNTNENLFTVCSLLFCWCWRWCSSSSSSKCQLATGSSIGEKNVCVFLLCRMFLLLLFRYFFSLVLLRSHLHVCDFYTYLLLTTVTEAHRDTSQTNRTLQDLIYCRVFLLLRSRYIFRLFSVRMYELSVFSRSSFFKLKFVIFCLYILYLIFFFLLNLVICNNCCLLNFDVLYFGYVLFNTFIHIEN